MTDQTITIPAPAISTGPQGKTEHEAAADYLREMATRVPQLLAGSGVSALVTRLFTDAIAALDELRDPASTPEPPRAPANGAEVCADANGLDLNALREKSEAAIEAWLWHEATDDLVAGYGHHMSQMLYRLPRDRQTDDMRESITALVSDNRALIAEVTRLRGGVGGQCANPGCDHDRVTPSPGCTFRRVQETTQ